MGACLDGVKIMAATDTYFKRHKYIKLLIIAGLIIASDQFTKALVLHYMPLHSTISVVPGGTRGTTPTNVSCPRPMPTNVTIVVA